MIALSSTNLTDLHYLIAVFTPHYDLELFIPRFERMRLALDEIAANIMTH
jgi:hypothetical protein